MPGLAWQATLRKSKEKLDLKSKGMRGRIFYAIYRYMKANSKYVKDYNKIKNYYNLGIGISGIFIG